MQSHRDGPAGVLAFFALRFPRLGTNANFRGGGVGDGSSRRHVDPRHAYAFGGVPPVRLYTATATVHPVVVARAHDVHIDASRAEQRYRVWILRHRLAVIRGRKLFLTRSRRVVSVGRLWNRLSNEREWRALRRGDGFHRRHPDRPDDEAPVTAATWTATWIVDSAFVSADDHRDSDDAPAPLATFPAAVGFHAGAHRERGVDDGAVRPHLVSPQRRRYLRRPARYARFRHLDPPMVMRRSSGWVTTPRRYRAVLLHRHEDARYRSRHIAREEHELHDRRRAVERELASVPA